MDPDVEIMYQVTTAGGISRQQLKVCLSSQFNRQKPLPTEHEQNLDSIWKHRCQLNPKLWNGTKFRLHSVTECAGLVTFNLGITDYKDFLGTNWSPNALALLQEIPDDKHCFMSDALGVGNLVITSDECIVLIRRSKHCGEAVGLLDVPGGHPEPSELVGRIPSSQIKIEELKEEDVINEIFNSTLNEVVEEVNIPKEKLSDPILIGVARNNASAGRPSSEYIVRCNMTCSDVEQLYARGTQSEAEESTDLIFLPLNKVMKLQDDVQIWTQMAPSAKGCIVLYQAYVSSVGYS